MVNATLFLLLFLRTFAFHLYSVANANVDFDKNMFLLKNPQFSPNYYETFTQ